MTVYGIDDERQALVATWPEPPGYRSAVVADVASCDPDAALDLTHELSRLNDAMWDVYRHPAPGEPDTLPPNSDEWRHSVDAQALDGVTDTIRDPNQPVDGHLLVSYVVVEERANRLGRILAALGSPGVTEAVLADVELERAAVRAALVGDLAAPRARQAVTLSRPEGSPTQVQAAHHIFANDPFGTTALFTDLEPAAAAIAAAHWLWAAAQVAGEAAGVDPTNVVVEADNLEALPVESATAVLGALDEGLSPREVVTDLIAEALSVAAGVPADPSTLAADLIAAHQRAEEVGVEVSEMRVRLCVLDPARPALDLLEDLVEGIRGCWLLYDEVRESDDTGDDDDVDWDALRAESLAAFAEEVRDTAHDGLDSAI